MTPRKLFTLIELLVVIAVIAILAALLLPSLSKARDFAKRSHCVGNEKQQAVAISLYAGDSREWMPVSNVGGDYRGWRAQLAPYLGIPSSHYAIYVGWMDWFTDSYMTKTFKCIAAPDPAGQFGGYGWNAPRNPSMGYSDTQYCPRVFLPNVKLPSQTIVCGEGIDAMVNGTWEYAYMYPPSWGNPLVYVGNRHAGGINIVWADGHVAWKSRSALAKGENGNTDWYYDPTRQ